MYWSASVLCVCVRGWKWMYFASVDCRWYLSSPQQWRHYILWRLCREFVCFVVAEFLLPFRKNVIRTGNFPLLSLNLGRRAALTLTGKPLLYGFASVLCVCVRGWNECNLPQLIADAICRLHCSDAITYFEDCVESSPSHSLCCFAFACDIINIGHLWSCDWLKLLKLLASGWNSRLILSHCSFTLAAVCVLRARGVCVCVCVCVCVRARACVRACVNY